MCKSVLCSALLAGAVLTAVPHAALAQATRNFPVIGTIHRLDPKLDELIPKDAKIEVLSSRFQWAEGPVWDKASGTLFFSDVIANQTMQWKEGEGVSVYLRPSGYTGPLRPRYSKEPGANGLMMDREGRLISCEHGDRRLSILTKGGGKRTLVDNYEGKRLNSPNDGCIKSNGDIYFTDPPYGLPQQEGPPRELDFCGVYRLATDGKLTLLTKDMTRPNGIAFSPDEKTLYVAQSDPEGGHLEGVPRARRRHARRGQSVFRRDAERRQIAGPAGRDESRRQGEPVCDRPRRLLRLHAPTASCWAGSKRAKRRPTAPGATTARSFISAPTCTFAA